MSRQKCKGYTLIELLVTVAIIGTLGAMAVAKYSGSQKHARLVGDAQSNFAVMRMMLETVRADQGLYPPAAIYTWKADGTRPTVDVLPAFQIKDHSRLDFTLTVNADRLTYVVEVKNPSNPSEKFLKQDQNLKDVP